MLKKSLLFKDFASSTPPPNPNTSSKALSLMDLQSRAINRWNQSDLCYFNSHLDKAHDESKIVSVGKDVYYRNIVLFVQRLHNLVTFKRISLVKTNITTSFWGFALEWYTSELSDFNRDALNNNPGIKSWINTLSHYFKIPISVALGLLADETYFFDDAHIRWLPAQYVCIIMRYGIECNIIDVANQLSFAYQGIALELWVFVSPPTELTKAANFIHVLEEKQEVWHKMMTTPTTSYRYYNLAWRPSPSSYRLPFLSQSKVFSCYQSQQCVPQAQLPWQRAERPTGLIHASPIPAPQAAPVSAPQCSYT